MPVKSKPHNVDQGRTHVRRAGTARAVQRGQNALEATATGFTGSLSAPAHRRWLTARVRAALPAFHIRTQKEGEPGTEYEEREYATFPPGRTPWKNPDLV